MKKTSLTALLALGLTELSASTPVSAQGIDTFVGPYIGVHAGYFTSDATFKGAPYTATGLGDTFPIPGRNDSFEIDGPLAGVHGGINFLLGTNFIGGLEGGWTWLNGDDSVTFSGTGTTTTGNDGFSFQSRSELEYEWQGTIRGRLGFVAGNTMFFTTAGVAFLNVDWSETATIQEAFGPSSTLNHSDSDTLVGGVVGGGVEIAITPTVIFGADYLYENFGSFNSVPHGFLNVQRGKIDDLDIHKVRVRLSVKLGGPPQ